MKAALVARLAASEPEPTATAKPTAAEASEAAGATASKAARATPAAKVKKPTAKMRAAETAPTPQKRRERTRKDAPALTGGREVEEGGCVLDLDGADLVRGVVARRPSARNKSPYVGDVLLEDGREVIVHMPSMDMGGKCCAGAAVLMRPSRNKKGVPVGDKALGPYGTPKCEFILQLLRIEERENEEAGLGGVWIGAHPTIGERLAQGLIEGGLLLPELGAVSKVQREVSGVAGCDMRTDFLLSHPSPSPAGDHLGSGEDVAEGRGKREVAGAEGGAEERCTVLEVKTVVDTDYDPALRRSTGGGKVPTFLGHTVPYARAAIFPWGRGAQKGPDGEKVVSARAIKHVRELTAIASGERTEPGVSLCAALLFVVIRHDATLFRPNAEACASFARYVRDAKAAGVIVMARRVRWGEGEDLGKAFDAGAVPVRLE